MSVLAIDIGTTRTKVALYDDHLRRGPVESAPTPSISETGTFDAGTILTALIELIGTALSKVPTGAGGAGNGGGTTDSISAVCLTSFLSHIMYDAAGNVVGPALTWSFRPEQDAIDACVAACRGAGYIAERPVGPELLAPRLVHIARHHKDLAGRISNVMSLKDTIRTMLSDRPDDHFIDWSVRDYSFMRDRFDQPISSIMGLLRREGYNHPEQLLPPALPANAPAGRLSPEMAQQFHLAPGIPLAAGATDGTTAMYGGGVLAENRIVVVFGTTDVVMRSVPSHECASTAAAEAGLSRNAAMIPGHDIVGGSTSSSGGAKSWMENLLSASDEWETIPPGAEGVQVAPGFAGERAPWNAPEKRGAIGGLALGHTGAHIARAVLEAQTFRIRFLTEQILAHASGGADPVLLGGGGNRSAALDTLRQDVLPWVLRWRSDQELSLCGAAMFACAAAGQDEIERDETLLRLCRLVAEDTHNSDSGSTYLQSAGNANRYSYLYTQWREWVAHIYGEKR